MIQAAILIFSCSSVFLLSGKRFFRYGFVIGLLGQPFWIYETWRLEQWGMFGVTVWFTFSYLLGIWNNFYSRGQA